MRRTIVVLLIALIYFAVNLDQKANAHCDTKSGPVITAAKEALNSGNVN